MDKRFQIVGYRSEEKGMALILAIGFLAILSILGAVVFEVSTRDLGETASFKPAREAFYAADRAVEYSMNTGIILNLAPEESINLYTGVKMDKDGNAVGAASTVHLNNINLTTVTQPGKGSLVSGTVTDLGPDDLPPSVAALYGSDFGANFYHVEVETSAPGNATSNVNASIVRLFKSDDDTIFRTSGGG